MMDGIGVSDFAAFGLETFVNVHGGAVGLV